MSSSPQGHDTAIDEQAACWAARLDGDVLDASERTALDTWLAQSPAHRAALSDYCQFSADLEEQLPQLVAAGALAMPPKKSVRRAWTFPTFAAVAFAAAAAVIFGLWFTRSAQPIENIATAVAQRKEHTLADGTRVELNAHTSLRFENSTSERRAILAGGEAIFMVAKDPARPFIVETPAGSVRVTGTVFNVRTDAQAAVFEVTVLEGSVQVRPGATGGAKSGDEPFALTAGQQLSARAGQVVQKALTSAALEDTLAWRRGQIVFNDVPLREAAARFAHYHGRAITVHPDVAHLGVGGQYALDDRMGFLQGMEEAFSLHLSLNPDGAAFLNPRRAP